MCSILMVAPRAADARVAGQALRAAGIQCNLKRVASERAFVMALRGAPTDIVLFDFATAKLDPVTALWLLRDLQSELPFILLIGPGDKPKIPRQLKNQMTEVVLKTKPAELAAAVRRACREQQEKKRRACAEAASRRNEELLRLLIEQVNDCAIYLLDSAGHVASWNVGAERITGYTMKEAMGRPMNHCFTRAEIMHGKPGRELKIALSQGRVQAEGWCRRKNGESYYAQWTITALRDESGKPAGFLKVARDITERQQYAEAISNLNAELEQRVRERTAQLEDANQELEAFSYSVSHDLRAPLRHIDGFVEILQETAAPKLDSENREYLNTISQAARQMGKLIDSLLAFSRLSRTPVNKRPIQLNTLVRDVLTQLKPETDGRKIDWAIDKLPEVQADPILLKQAVLNLISNAVKYSRSRSRARIEIGACGNPGEHVVFVRDNGVGFDMRHSDKLFGAFQRLHRSNEFEGTGVGLANVRRIIHRHGGRTWAEGVVEQGATFYFSLPKECKEA